jgi:hypothetical protein
MTRPRTCEALVGFFLACLAASPSSSFRRRGNAPASPLHATGAFPRPLCMRRTSTTLPSHSTYVTRSDLPLQPRFNPQSRSVLVTATRLVRPLLALLASVLFLATTTAFVTLGLAGGARVGADNPDAQVVVLRHDGIGVGQRLGNSAPSYDSASAADVEEEYPVVPTSRPAPGYAYDSDAHSYDAHVRRADARTLARVEAAGVPATVVLPRRQVGAAAVGSVSFAGFVVAAKGGGGAAGRDALGRFTGAGGYGAGAEARGLSDYELATGQTVIRNQVRAVLSDGGRARYYDGLVQNAGGTYTGIEVKSGSASLSAPQRAFDTAVNGGAAARATLSGQPITITSTELVRVR